MVDGLIASRQGCAWESGLQRRYDTCLWDPGGDTSVTSSASAVNENECLYSRCSVSCYLECASGSRTCWTLGKKLVWYAFREPSLRGKTYSSKMSKCYNGGLSRLLGFSGGSDSKESACNVGDPNSKPRSGWSPWRRKWQPTAVFLPGESRGLRSMPRGACPEEHAVHGAAKSWTRLSMHKPSRVLGVKRGASSVLGFFSINYSPH